MDFAKQHWPILRELGADLANRVRTFMVVGWDGEGVLAVTENGKAFWIGKIELDQTRTTSEPIPLDVPGLVVQMAQGDSHILLLTNSGEIFTMKRNYAGMLGLESDICGVTHFTPQLIPVSTSKFISVRCGSLHSLALTEDGKVWGWGWNCYGQVGVSGSADSFSSPNQILELDPYRVITIECGGDHSLALTDQGVVWGWGRNDMGQLGDGSETSKYNSTQIPTPTLVKSIAAGLRYSLLLTVGGEVYACGSNQYGQLGLLPCGTKSSPSLSKVKGLPFISQIVAHPLTHLSIAMSSDQRCFVWGELRDRTSISTPRELSSDYCTVESPLSFYSPHRSTPYSVDIIETLPNRLSARMSRMFDNPETSDVQFVVEQQRTIHAHQNILSNSSDYFARMFSKRWLPKIDSEDSIVKVTISDHSYEAFHAFLCYFYIESLEFHSSDLLPELFELASLYLVPDLQQLCISRMRTTLTPATCCLYYPLTHRHSQLPELATFQQELVQFVSTQMSEVVHSVAYQSMESDLRDNLANAVQNLLVTC